MKTIVSFSGGPMDNEMFFSTWKTDGDAANHYYALSRSGEVGHQFPVPDGSGGFDLYGVVKRLESGGCVIVQATYAGHFSGEPMELCEGRR
jgi:hypothetical protein